jgi:hypothetical protein
MGKAHLHVVVLVLGPFDQHMVLHCSSTAAMATDRARWSSARTAIPAAVSKSKGMG